MIRIVKHHMYLKQICSKREKAPIANSDKSKFMFVFNSLTTYLLLSGVKLIVLISNEEEAFILFK